MPTIDLAAVDAIAFDIDGVVLESTELKTEAFRELFADYPEHIGEILGYHRRHLGVSRHVKFRWIFEELLGRPLTPEDSELLARRFAAIVLSRIGECPLVAGARASLASLSRRMPLFAVSGTPQEELEKILAARELDRYFRSIHGSPPPKTEILKRLIDELGLRPSRLLMVGDALSDYRAAREAGCRFLLRTTADQAEFFSALEVPRILDLTDLQSAERPPT